MATLTGAMDVALGQTFAGVFTNSDELWSKLETAGKTTADPFWRMPLHDDYLKGMKESLVADLVNSASRSGGSCSAAAFLKEFVSGLPETQWAHIDIAGVMESSTTEGYHIKGMSGKLNVNVMLMDTEIHIMQVVLHVLYLTICVVPNKECFAILELSMKKRDAMIVLLLNSLPDTPFNTCHLHLILQDTQLLKLYAYWPPCWNACV